MVHNAIKLVQESEEHLFKNKSKANAPHKTTIFKNSSKIRKNKVDTFKLSRRKMLEIYEEFDLNISRSNVGRHLNEAQFFERITRKIPLLLKRHIGKRLEFAKTPKNRALNFWTNILWTDKTNINRMQPDGKSTPKRP